MFNLTTVFNLIPTKKAIAVYSGVFRYKLSVFLKGFIHFKVMLFLCLLYSALTAHYSAPLRPKRSIAIKWHETIITMTDEYYQRIGCKITSHTRWDYLKRHIPKLKVHKTCIVFNSAIYWNNQYWRWWWSGTWEEQDEGCK